MPNSAPRRQARRPPMVSPELRDARALDAAAPALSRDSSNRTQVLVELRLEPGQLASDAQTRFQSYFARVMDTRNPPPEPVPVGRHYARCALTTAEITRLVSGGTRATTESAADAVALIYRVWPDIVMHAHLDKSLSTVQADAASRTYSCSGAGVVWAVVDSGVDQNHPHFSHNQTVLASNVKPLHRDFTVAAGQEEAPLVDVYGHGTHVAGIIAGQAPGDPKLTRIAANEPTKEGMPNWGARTLPPGSALTGVAPRANLVSLKVLDDSGQTLSSTVIDALDHIRTVNAQSRDPVIHGVNLSLGCAWLPREYAAGQSPLCRELNRLVGTGVVAVVSAGNTGASANAGGGGPVIGMTADMHGQFSTITDPGNAEDAITVGSVHRSKPHTFGVTFDSAKGPTLDGRLKPDLVAPGERITSAATGNMADGVEPLASRPDDPPIGPEGVARYIEDSGTSMAAAHVSGVLAAFLSARDEFIGRPSDLKRLLIDSATDLSRHEYFQGAGLVNLMRALSNT
jgi:subtilisin family serine protease